MKSGVETIKTTIVVSWEPSHNFHVNLENIPIIVLQVMTLNEGG